MAHDTSPQPRPPRRQKPPPPPPPLLEFGILKQVESALGLTLWKAIRNVRTWAEVEPEARRRYFRPLNDDAQEILAYAKHEAPELEAPLSAFALLVQAPDVIDAEQIAEACDAVHQWADERGMMLTALLFTEAAAYVLPHLPNRANQAARAARRNLMRNRAAVWYLRAYKLAVVSDNKRERRRESIWALLGYGAMMRDAGNYDEARKFVERAARRAVRFNRKKETGMAYHELFVIAAERAQFTLAGKHARSAIAAYPVRHPNLPHFAHDVAFEVYIRQRQFPGALAILSKVLPLMRLSRDQALTWSSLAWAAGGAGLRERYREAERATLEHVAGNREFAPAIFIHLAHGARALWEWDRAQRYAEAARESASQNGDRVLEKEAAELLESITRREPPPPQAEPDDALESLARLIVTRLGRWRAPGQGRPGTGEPPTTE
jgi:tetratricopeptide (TPR) repeat protein